jgi:hypothetical protein
VASLKWNAGRTFPIRIRALSQSGFNEKKAPLEEIRGSVQQSNTFGAGRVEPIVVFGTR